MCPSPPAPAIANRGWGEGMRTVLIPRLTLILREATRTWRVWGAVRVLFLPLPHAFDEQDLFAEMQTHAQWLKRWRLNFDHLKNTVTLHDYGKPITKHKINPKDNDIRHILQIPVSRGYGQNVNNEDNEDNDDDDDDNDSDVSTDSEFRDKHWFVVGWWRLWHYCQTLEEGGEEEFPSNWQEMVLEEDCRPVSSGWPRDDEEKRKEFAETLTKFLLEEDEWEVHVCPKGHKMQYSLLE
ncbi:hypothetical protein B0H10DRAFT_1959725 [Mycena sp. CBHHK59/15]|nr:hypothetical protein B0H10DRAFT_1959725 [Mycena sp. CBHHK59/15]